MQDHRQLRVWAKAHAHILNVRDATRQFPRTGYSELKTQMTRAAESVGFNIVEGCGSSTAREFARFLDISIKSATELDYQLLLSKDYGILEEGDWKTLSKKTIVIRRMLCGLRSKVLAGAPAPKVKPPRKKSTS
jgi:four helix bundle protein